MNDEIDKEKILHLLNAILEAELAGVVRYTHYSFMVYGYSRIPIVSWLREQASESMMHAQEAGEIITALGGHPSLKVGTLLESHKHDIRDILSEALETEHEGVRLYEELLEQVENRHVALEEYARQKVHEEQLHIWEVDKMLRAPGDIRSFVEKQSD